MTDAWLLLDMNYLLNVQFHGLLKHSEDPGEFVIESTLDTVRGLMDQYATENVVWAFDVGEPHRCGILPTYKSTRKKQRATRPASEQAARATMIQNSIRLTETLRAVGAAVVAESGYEADDCLAAAANHLFETTEDFAVIVSSDGDLHQCLREERVIQYRKNAKQPVLTEGSLFAEYGVSPKQWAQVKAIAGCGTDDIPGIDGVAEKTASLYLRGELPATSAKYKAIVAGIGNARLRMPLTKLPWPHTPLPDWSAGRQTLAKLRSLYREWGFQWQS